MSDRTRWISPLAVAPDERGRGLDRALVLASFDRLVANGAVDREWQRWELPAPA